MRSAPERYWPVSELGFAAISRGRAAGHQFAAEAARAGAEIDHVVGALDGLGVVLDHQHRVAQVAQAGQRVEQAAVVARVQADGGLVEHVEHAAQLGADLRGQADALRLAAGERVRGAIQAQVIEADGAERTRGGCGSRRRCGRRSARSRSLNSQARAAGRAWATDSAVNSPMERPFTRTARLAGRRRWPWQAGQVAGDM